MHAHTHIDGVCIVSVVQTAGDIIIAVRIAAIGIDLENSVLISVFTVTGLSVYGTVGKIGEQSAGKGLASYSEMICSVRVNDRRPVYRLVGYCRPGFI